MRQHQVDRPMFGKRMGEFASPDSPEREEEQRSPLSEERARRVLDERTASVPDTDVLEEELAQEIFFEEEKEEEISANDGISSKSVHFGVEAPEAQDEEEIPTKEVYRDIDPSTTRRMKRIKHKTGSGERHPFLAKIWNLFFSDTSFKKDDCLMPRTAPGFDRIFFLAFMVLLGIGSVMVFSSSYAYAEARYGDSAYFVRRQIIFAVLGIGVMLVASMMTVDFYRMITRVAFGATVFLLMLVPVIGINLNGAKRWIGFGPITVQPTEIAKLTMVMILAYYFDKYGHRMREKTSFIRHFCYNTAFPGIFICTICGLVMLQKHLSGIIILGTVGIIVMFIAGTDGRHLASLIGIAGAGVACIAIFTDYTKRRIDIWQDPYAMRLDGGWQTIQGLNAIGSGGFLGLGIGDSRMKYSWVSEPANDFIFTITCEELGFIGAFVILCFFALFVWRGFVIAMHCEDTYAKLLCVGIISKVAVQTLLNLAVITNTIPNTGIPLPFFSYGGTSLIIQLMEVGIVLSISRTSNLATR